jgi:ADP-ribose pyrophosphatase YjhB (NUDIX family)
MSSTDPDGPTNTDHKPLAEGFRGDTGAPPAPSFCSACGDSLAERFHPPDGCPRLVCVTCGRVQYRNPTVVGSVILEQNGEVLLLRRARAPRAETWVFPGGFVELGETVAGAATRECIEETGIEPRIGDLLGVYDRPGPGVVIVVYRATVASGTPRPGIEASEVRWFRPDSIPWTQLAFDTTEAALRDWVTGAASVRT